jgi:hypothetical protein
MNTTEKPSATAVGGSALSEGLGVTVGDAVMLLADLYEGPDDCHPGGYLAKRGEKLIVRRVSDRVTFEGDVMGVHVSHEDRTDGLTFAVRPSEIGPWRVTPNVRANRPDTAAQE